MSVDRGLLVILEAQPGKEDELAAFLAQAQPLAAAEPGTVTWYAFKLSETTYGIFDTFADENGRQAHLNGPIAAALGQAGPGLLAKDPEIQRPISSPRSEPPSVFAGRADYRRTSPPGRLAGFQAGAAQLSRPRPAGVEDKSGGLLRHARWPRRVMMLT